ncbi:MAG TPA: hypothetical protein VMY16_03090 [Ilumatobacteraceae bacterium]|nr:hypothetical protein [Ilumatobacteraceae bacterium]
MTDTVVEDLEKRSPAGQDEAANSAPRHPRTRADRVIDVFVAFTCFAVGTAWTFNPFRTQFTGGTFANYFEGQARAFLDGNLALEEGVLGIEAFIRDGKEFMYFGPFLGVIRVPFALLSDGLDGRLTLMSLFIGTALLYWQSNKLLDHILVLVHPGVDQSTTERWFRIGWRISVATGTVVLTLLSIPWGYHEAHLWSAALFITVLNQMMRFSEMPTNRMWIFGVTLLALVLNRPTTAYAGLIGVAALFAVSFWRKLASRRALLQLAGWFTLAFVATVSVNWAKFRRPFGIPMEDQFFTKVDANRAEMLARYDNKYFQTEFIPSNLWAYFRPDGVDISGRFPFIDAPRSLPWVWGDAFYDATYRTASVTATNPLLLIGSVIGVIAFVRLWREPSFWRLAPVVGAGILAAGGVAGWGYIATRYLTDFLPGMLVLTAIAIAVFVRYVNGRTEPINPVVKRVGQVGAIALITWSIVANVAIAFNYSYSLGDRLDHMSRLLDVQDAAAGIIGSSPADRTVFLDELPYERYDPAEVGTLAIIGDCEALYYSNGDTVDTWVAVEYGDSDWRRDYLTTSTDELAVGYEIELVRLSESSSFDEDAYWFSLVLRVDDIRPDDNEIEYTLTMIDTFGELPAEELVMPLDDPSVFSITFDENRGTFFVERDGRNILYGHFDMDPLYDSPDPGISWLPAGDFGGMTFETLSLDTPWCDRLAAAATP